MTDNSEKPNTEPSTTLPVLIKLTGRMLNFSRLQLQGDDVEQLFDKIAEKFSKQQNSKLPVVVSYEGNIALETLWQKLWDSGLQPIGIIPSNEIQSEQANAQKIAIFPADGQRIDGKNPKHRKDKLNNESEKSSATTENITKTDDKPISENENSKNATTSDTTITQTSEQAKEQPTETTKTELTDNLLDIHKDEIDNTENKLYITQPEINAVENVEGDLVHHQMLRSGQSINHVGGDVILTKGINAGAEAITDYSLHIYGKAEGRLVAGATGDKNARIFCMKFNPSLVSVAGTYCLKENIPTELLNKAVEVSFDDEKGLIFTLIE